MAEITRLKCNYGGVAKPYGRAVKVGNLIFVSGLAGIDPKTNQVVIDPIWNCRVEETVKAQTEVAVKKIEATLKELGASLGDVVQATILLTKVETYPIVAQTMAKMFPPGMMEEIAATGFEVSSLVPPGAYVEIEVTAVAPEK